jgi:hypothetical protein
MESIPFGLTFYQAMQAVGFIVGCASFLLVVAAFVLDKLNVKSFSFRTGFTFYQDGEPKRVTKRSVKK